MKCILIFLRNIINYSLLGVLFITLSTIYSCDYIAAGSNLMAERYEFQVSQDSLMHTVIDFNTRQNKQFKDSIFILDESNPNYYSGLLIDEGTANSYYVIIHKLSSNPTELELVSVRNYQTGVLTAINDDPKGKTEIMQRKAAIKEFEQHVLNKIGLPYIRKGSAMNKEY